MRAPALLASLFVASVAVVGCGGGGGGGADFGTPSKVYPAPHTALPQMQNGGGPVIASPRFTSVTWPGDLDAPLLDDFTARLGGTGTSYWSLVAADYGVGAGTASAPGHVLTAFTPTTQTTPQLEAWLAAAVTTTSQGLPVHTANSIYLLFLPPGAALNDGTGAVSCTDYLGYHSSILVGTTNVSYALIPRCSGYLDLSDLDEATDTAAHEMIEAATDPYNTPAWFGTDTNGNDFNLYTGGGEVGDMCQIEQYQNLEPAGLPYIVQRSWSNSHAQASHDPCQPGLPGVPYFNAAPVLPDSISVDDGTGTLVPMKGLAIPVGGSKTVEVDFFSDADTGGPFFVSAYDFESAGSPTVTPTTLVSLDRDYGQNGEKVHLTITVQKKGTVFPSSELVVVQAELNGYVHFWPIFVKS